MRFHKFLTAALVLISAAARAADAPKNNLLFGGAEAGNNGESYGQAGIITPLTGGFGNGLALRGVIDGLTYRYRSGQTVSADAGGGELTLGYQSSGAPGWWSIFTGPAYQYTAISPDDPSSKTRGNVWGWVIQGEAEHQLTENFKVNLSGNYTVAENNPYWTRLRLLFRLSEPMYAGPEFIYQGDSDYHAWAIGGSVIGLTIDSNTQLGVHAGMQKVENLSAGPYGGIEIGTMF